MRRIGIVVVGAAMCFGGAARADLLVNISKSQQQLSVTVDGEEAFRWAISTGRKGYTTPSGSFSPIRLERHWYSHKYQNAPMPWSVFFHRGYAVHGTMEATNLGHAASHGCVRLRPDHAAVLYSLVRQEGIRHTRIVVSDKPLPRPHAPKDVPVATKAPGREAEKARAHPGHDAFAQAEPARANHVRVSTAMNDEARVLREREAWLRGLDRKYGIVR